MPSNIEQKIKELADEMAEEFSTLDDAQDAVMERVDLLRECTYYSDAKELVLNFSREDEYTAFDELKGLDVWEDINCLDDMFTKLAWAYCYQSLYKALEDTFTDKEEENEEQEALEIAQDIAEDIMNNLEEKTILAAQHEVEVYLDNNTTYQNCNGPQQEIIEQEIDDIFVRELQA